MPRRPPISTETSQAYATRIEFCRVFAENMDNLHLLSFLLTADLAKAEECFVSGLENCVEGTYVFRDWAQSWARRTIIQNAIRMLAPRKNHSTVADAPSDAVTRSFGRMQDPGNAIARILRLQHFERFVFVMSVLEKYSDQDCSVLLGCSRQDVGETRIRALLHLAESDRSCTVAPSGCGSTDPEEAQTPEVQLEPQF
jgi:DNA-directed RNA polymerase specialized sigma24 family protein